MLDARFLVYYGSYAIDSLREVVIIILLLIPLFDKLTFCHAVDRSFSLRVPVHIYG